MKRIFTFCLIFLLLPLAASAAAQPVVDGAGVLTEAEIVELTETLSELRDTYNMDVAVVTADTMTASSAQAEADDIFDYQGYGVGSDYDGILFYLYLGADGGRYAFSTCGRGIDVFYDDALEDIDNACLSYLQSGSYASAFRAYANRCERYLQQGGEEKSPLVPILAIIFVPLFLALILTKNKLSQMMTATKKASASDYQKPGSLSLTRSHDVFLYSNVIRTAKPKNESSSTHTSSSGRSHGGRSGSF